MAQAASTRTDMRIARALGYEEAGHRLNASMQERMQSLSSYVQGAAPPRGADLMTHDRSRSRLKLKLVVQEGQACRPLLPRALLRSILAALLALPLAPAKKADAKPHRIVSINLCTDQILLMLVPRERIQALSHLAADSSVSAAFQEAHGIAATRGEAETVLAFDPDLVIAGAFSTPATTELLERLGRQIIKAPLAGDIDGIRNLVRLLARAVGEHERGEQVLQEFDRRLGSVEQHTASHLPPHARPRALSYQVNGLASGAGSLLDSALARAGFQNHALGLGLPAGSAVPLETLVVNPPHLLILAGPIDEYRTVLADNLRHPVLAKLRETTPTLTLPWRTWLCGTPQIVDVIEQLAVARRDIEAHLKSRDRGKP